MDKRINYIHFGLGVLVYLLGIVSFYVGNNFYQVDRYEWVIMGVFAIWICALTCFIVYAKRNDRKIWWVWFSVFFIQHPLAIIVMLAIWSIGGFAP